MHEPTNYDRDVQSHSIVTYITARNVAKRDANTAHVRRDIVRVTGTRSPVLSNYRRQGEFAARLGKGLLIRVRRRCIATERSQVKGGWLSCFAKYSR